MRRVALVFCAEPAWKHQGASIDDVSRARKVDVRDDSAAIRTDGVAVVSAPSRTCETCKYRLGAVCANLKATQHYKKRVAADHTCDRHRNDPDKAPEKITMIVCRRGR